MPRSRGEREKERGTKYLPYYDEHSGQRHPPAGGTESERAKRGWRMGG